MGYAFPQGNLFYRTLTTSLPKIVKGEGIYLYDEGGKQYLDAAGGAIVVNIGHGVEEVADAMFRQARTIAYVNGTQFTNGPAESLAGAIARVMPDSLNKVYFLTSGSEATEAAIKLARQYWLHRGHERKFKAISHDPGYHGATLGALAVSGRPRARRLYRPLLHDFPLIPAPTCYRCPFGKTHPGCNTQCARELERAIQHEGEETVSAFITEPIIGSSAGVAEPPRDYFEIIRDTCTRYDVLLIADEVMTGMGRTGTYLAIEHFGITPDVVLLGKGLSGGYAPLSAMVTKQEIVETIAESEGTFVHGLTFAHTPVICAAGMASFEYLKKHQLIERSGNSGRYLLDKLQALYEFPFVGDVRGKGLFAGIELVADRESKRPFPREVALTEKICTAAKRNGLVLWPNVGHVDGNLGDLIILGPPLVITEEQIDTLVDLLMTTLREVGQEQKGNRPR